MALIEFYAIFAIATALTALVGVFWPLLKEARSKGISNTLVDAPVLSSIIFVCITIVLAPFVISSLVFPSHSETFRLGLQRVVEQPDDKNF